MTLYLGSLLYESLKLTKISQILSNYLTITSLATHLKKRVGRALTVAVERAIYVVILCFFALGSATTCSYDSECDQFSGESCCSNSVCRKTCFHCSSNSDCVTGEECCNLRSGVLTFSLAAGR